MISSENNDRTVFHSPKAAMTGPINSHSECFWWWYSDQINQEPNAADPMPVTDFQPSRGRTVTRTAPDTVSTWISGSVFTRV